ALRVEKGEIVWLVGANGGGKAKVSNCLTGFYKPSAGSIRSRGEEDCRMLGFRRARQGVVGSFQHVRLFRQMSVVENLLVAQHHHMNTSMLAGLFKTPGFRRSEKEAMERAAWWLERMDLLEFANRTAGTLAYGQQRRLEIARCMVTRPTLLMLDEPAAGLNPRETADLQELIAELRSEHGMSILLI